MIDASSPSPTARHPRSKTRTRVFMLVLILSMLLLVEGAARLMYALTSKSWGLVVPPEIGRLDPVLGWALKPGAFGSSKRTGYRIDYRINSKGLRDEETAYEKPAGVTRIVLIGDSNTFGFGVPIEKHFSTLIEGYLPDVECVNMGVDGYGVGQELLFLRTEGFKYQPDVVMAYVPHFVSERHLHTMRWNMGKPRYVLTPDGELLLENSPVTNNKTWYVWLRRLDRVASNSMAYSILRDLVINLGAAMLHENEPAHAATLGDGAGAKQTPPPPPDTARPESMSLAEWEHQKKLYSTAMAIFQAMDEDCAARGATFVLVTKMPQVKALAELYGIRCMDVSQPLRNERFPLPDNLAHVNESGNGVLAWEIVQYLEREGLAPSMPTN